MLAESIAKLNIIGDFAAPQFVVENRHGNAFISLDPLPAAKTDLMVEADPSRAGTGSHTFGLRWCSPRGFSHRVNVAGRA